ncbi:hypothetical Protein YC6258_05701 [Gynuella sunshinyii YC6258]|uniref:Uncharacterized protein n=1 Tax=Gynuella sunshinyii YC6258 TaxID=1445510 RepID=A0A0C5W558_9GAMM|nr:hypothetical Protein YC6258_05701 [Gynuella sunshinyii YC6258]
MNEKSLLSYQNICFYRFLKHETKEFRAKEETNSFFFIPPKINIERVHFIQKRILL